MVNLKFKEKVALKMFIKNGRLYDQISKIELPFINKIFVSILMDNPQLLKEIIIKTIEKSSAEYELFMIIENEGVCHMTDDEFELWKQLKAEVVEQYLSSNICDVYKISSIMNVQKEFKLHIKKMIDNNELNREMIDKIIQIPTSDMDSCWLPFTISLLREKGKQDLFLYALEKMQLDLISKINQQELSPEEKEIIIQSLNQNIGRYVRGGLNDSSLNDIYYSGMINIYYSKIVSLARIGNSDLQGLTINQINNINIKNANEIIELAKEKYKDVKIDENFNTIFYKMYIVFGKQRTIELIEGKYGEIFFDKIESIMEKVNIDNYCINQKNAEPSYDKYQKSLINFLFASGVNDINANIKKIISGEITEEQISLNRLINEWKIYYNFLGGNPTIADLIKVMDNLVEGLILPNEKEIENTVKLAGVEYKNKISEIYQKMQKRTKSQIPKVKGVAGKYEYEILDLIDPTQMDVGYHTKCCFTFGGNAENSLIHACTSEDSRIFVIRENGEIVAQSWVWRNGNTICFDNIEVYGVSSKAGSKFWHVYEQAANEMLNVSKKSESEDKKVQLITIGKGNTEINLVGKNLICDKIPLPKKEKLYTDAKSQVIVATSDDYEKYIEFDVDAIYEDERKKVIAVDPQQSSQEAIKKLNEHIDRINYSLNPEKNPGRFKKCNSSEEYTFVMYGSDWFIGITVSGEIVKRENSFDERCKTEVFNALNLIVSKIKNGELANNINDVMLDNMLKESTTYGK